MSLIIIIVFVGGTEQTSGGVNFELIQRFDYSHYLADPEGPSAIPLHRLGIVFEDGVVTLSESGIGHRLVKAGRAEER